MYRDETKNLVNFANNVNWELFDDGVISFSQISLSSSDISASGNSCEVLDNAILDVISNKRSLYHIINFKFSSSSVPPSGGTNSYYSIEIPRSLMINNISYRPFIISARYSANGISSDTAYNQVLYPEIGASGSELNFRTLSAQRISLSSSLLSGMQFTAIYYIRYFSDALI